MLTLLTMLTANAGQPEVHMYSYSSGGVTLGVQVTGLPDSLQEHFGGSPDAGVLIAGVQPGTAAETAGLAIGDLLVRVGDTEVDDIFALRQAVWSNAGSTVELEVVRDGRRRKLKAELPESTGDMKVLEPRIMERFERWDPQPFEAPRGFDVEGFFERDEAQMDELMDRVEALEKLLQERLPQGR